MQYIFFSALFVANEKPDLMLYYRGQMCEGNSHEVEKSRQKVVFSEDKPCGTCTCLLHKDTHVQTHKRQSKKAPKRCALEERYGRDTIFVESLRHAPAH